MRIYLNSTPINLLLWEKTETDRTKCVANKHFAKIPIFYPFLLHNLSSSAIRLFTYLCIKMSKELLDNNFVHIIDRNDVYDQCDIISQNYKQNLIELSEKNLLVLLMMKDIDDFSSGLSVCIPAMIESKWHLNLKGYLKTLALDSTGFDLEGFDKIIAKITLAQSMSDECQARQSARKQLKNE